MMKLHWSPRSPYVRKVMLAAHELGLADRIERLRTVVAMSSANADLIPDNPLNKIPTLVLEDGRVLFDSYVILEYFDQISGRRPLIPTGGDTRLTALRRHALGSGFLDLLILARNERDRPEAQKSPVHMEAFAFKRAATLRHLENEVASFATDAIGIGEIAVGCALAYSDFRFDADPWRERHPRLALWHEAFEARPAARATQFQDG